MCLKITEESIQETEELKAKGLPIVAYKILELDMKSIYEGFQWKLGKNKSDRRSTELTEQELELMEINKGFHFFINKPEACQYQCQYQDPYLCQYLYLCQHQYRYQCLYWYRCRYRCQYRSQYQCILEKPVNKVFKVEIKPENLIALGTWEDLQSLAAIKCKIIEEVNQCV
jgi:hypothetical protein